MLNKFLTTLLALLILTFCTLAIAACGQLKEEGKQLGSTIVDCTKDTAIKAIDEYGPTVEQVIIDSLNGNGKLDKERVKSATKTFASDTARCVLASTIARLMRPPSSSSDAPQSSPLTVDLAGLQELRSEQLGDVRYKLPDGATL